MTSRELHHALGGTVEIMPLETMRPRVNVTVRIGPHIATAVVPVSSDPGLLAHPLVDALIGFVMAERETQAVLS